MAVLAGLRGWPDPEVAELSAVAPRGIVVAGDGAAPGGGIEFRWEWSGRPRTWEWFLLDAELRELAHSGGLETTTLRASGAAAAALRAGGRFHWLVRAAGGGGPQTIPVEFEVRR